MFNVPQILQLIKDKDKMPKEVFDTYITNISAQLNTMGYAEKGFNGGFDFQSFNTITNLLTENQSLKMTNDILTTSVMMLEGLADELCVEIKQHKDQLDMTRCKVKAEMISKLREL